MNITAINCNYIYKFYLEGDCPTFAQLCYFVLPITSFMWNCEAIFSKLVRYSHYQRADWNSKQEYCMEMFKAWIDGGTATWSQLFGAMHGLQLHKEIGQIYRHLQGTVILSSLLA